MTKAAPPPPWDALIIGGGPAGLAAGIHLARAGARCALIERSGLGGQARFLDRIENYPGFPRGIAGAALMERWVLQARRWGLSMRRGEAREVAHRGGLFSVRCGRGAALEAKAVLYCPGAEFKRLGVPGESRLRGRGVYHAAVEGAWRLRGRTVAVVGGGEAAAAQAIELSRRARKVYLISRSERLKAHRLLLRRLELRPNVARLARMSVSRIAGNGALRGVSLRPEGGGAAVFLEVEALFVLVGKTPPSLPFAGRPPAGFFPAGDAVGGDFRQVAIAAGDGVRAAMKCLRYLDGGGGR